MNGKKIIKPRGGDATDGLPKIKKNKKSLRRWLLLGTQAHKSSPAPGNCYFHSTEKHFYRCQLHVFYGLQWRQREASSDDECITEESCSATETGEEGGVGRELGGAGVSYRWLTAAPVTRDVVFICSTAA